MNRLATHKNISSTGQGERLRQTAGGVTTNYTVDLNAGLSQVLADGSYTYLYGNSRLAQSGASGAEYFLTDALGSVRQVVDEDGAVTLSKDYRPYGEVLSSQGQGTTSYGFAGEFTSSLTGQSYLRARWYAPSQGRFTSRDTWQGEYQIPASYNRWLYGYANPVRFYDPSGRYSRDMATKFALSHDQNDKFPDDGYFDFNDQPADKQCTIFVSSALSVGGYQTSGDWPGYEGTKLEHYPNLKAPHYDGFYNAAKQQGRDYQSTWLNAPALYTYLASSNPESKFPQNDNLYTTIDFNSKEWNDWILKNRSQIDRGDVVFYVSVWDVDHFAGNWGHVAMVVGWGSRTHYGENYKWEKHNCEQDGHSQASRPLVVDRSGAIKYGSSRSIDNTFEDIVKISVVHIR